MTIPPALDREVRYHIYRRFAATGRAPDVGTLASGTGASVQEVEASLDRLAADRAIVLAPGTRNLWMAHPFSAVPTPYPVRTSPRTYWANCAWDALGIAALLGVDARTETRCGDCGEALVIRVEGGRVSPGDAVVHFHVPPKRFWENVGFT